MKIDRHQLEETYRSMADEEVLRIAADTEALTQEASRLLGCELQRRHLGAPEIAPYRDERARMVAEKSRESNDILFFVGLLFGPIGYYLFKLFESFWGENNTTAQTG
jgi:hypothetical protein